MEINSITDPDTETMAVAADSLYWRTGATDQQSGQDEFMRAEAYLEDTLRDQDPEQNPRLWLVLALIRTIRVYSKSCNSVPGLKGQGYEETLEIAFAINETRPQTDMDLQIKSYRAAARNIASYLV